MLIVEWVEEIRKNNSNLKIVPRILFDDWSPEHLSQFLQNETWMNRCLLDLLNLLTRNRFDGAVVELWSNVMIHTRGEAVNLLIEMMNSWAATFHKRNKEFIVPVGPPLSSNNDLTGMFTPSHFNALSRHVDYIQIMTYDFPALGVSAVAPYDWVEQSIMALVDPRTDLASHLMLGLNHYGYEYINNKVQAVDFKYYLKRLKQEDTKLEWDNRAKEHFLKTSDSIIYYPSLTSIELRLNLARKYGIGVGIWDFGQGLNYFSQLL
ncbi:hypothetical protein DICVIV_12543 [Dictyocaulus viviparus]|uniref:Chitinase domain-containing protein 1 n=1 Tax=Dictyocaulus viviparus TaxID=29172 RepID=A0A0D8XCU8_DICVI|nr:hypothetical protein DICVIV_12543 [Dictyocaulus viviparus]